MIIRDIRSIATGETRTDGRCPKRIGCEIEYLKPIIIGDPAYFGYLKDKDGNEKEGYLRTSTVVGCNVTKELDIITTLNSVYVISKV